MPRRPFNRLDLGLMRPLRIYVDTSVIGGCLDVEFEEPSRALLDLARNGSIVHVDKIRRFNAVNLMEGHSTIDIRSPWEVA